MNQSIKARNCRWQSSLILLTTLLCTGRAQGAPPGEIDATFGENGRLVIQMAGSQFGRSITQQPADGKLLFPGSSSRGGVEYDFAVLRLNSDGTVDGTFGTNGTATVDFGSADAVAIRLAVQPDNRILVAGGAGGVLALARLNSDGAIDPTFGNNGRVTVDVGGVADSLSDITLLANGQFVVLGTTEANGRGDAVFARFGANGALDTTFGTGPVAGVTIVGVNGKHDELHSMIRQADGKFAACGNTVHIDNGIDYSSDMLAIRVNADGSVDSSFGSNGVSQIDDPAPHSYAQTCTEMRDGSLMLAGYRGGPGIADAALIRLLPDGRQDTTFGSAGISGFRLGRAASVNGMALLEDGSLVVTGLTVSLASTNLPTDMFIARVDPDSGLLDGSFGANGATIIDFGHSNEPGVVEGWGLIAQAGGKLIAVGQDLRSSLALARVDAAGGGNRGFAGFLATSATIAEATGNLVVTVRRTGGSTGNLAVDYTTVANQAVAPSDFTAVSGTLLWPAGDMNPKTIMVPIANDGMTESAEPFSIVLSNSTGGLAASEFNALIVDPKVAPPPPPPAPTPRSGDGGGGAAGLEALLILALLSALATRRRRREGRRREYRRIGAAR